MRFKFLKDISICVMMSVSLCANALPMIEDTNNKSFIDKVTALEWMDFDETVDVSYNEIARNMGIGQDFYGWEFASSDQLQTLWGNIFLGDGVTDKRPNRNGTGLFYASILETNTVWDEVLGIIGHTNVNMFDEVFVKAYDGNDVLTALHMRPHGFNATIFSIEAYLSKFGETADDIAYIKATGQDSTGLIRKVEVAEPSTILIFASGLAIFGLRRKS